MAEHLIEFEDEALRAGYTLCVPVLFWRDPRVSEGAKVLMAYLTRYAGMEGGGIFPSHKALGRELGKSDRTVRRWQEELEAAGYVRIESGAAGGETNIYYLSWRPCVESADMDKSVQGYDRNVLPPSDNNVLPPSDNTVLPHSVRERKSTEIKKGEVPAPVGSDTKPIPEVPRELDALAHRALDGGGGGALAEWVRIHPVEAVELALRRSLEQGKRAPRYCGAMLESMAREGYPEVNRKKRADLEAEQMKREWDERAEKDRRVRHQIEADQENRRRYRVAYDALPAEKREELLDAAWDGLNATTRRVLPKRDTQVTVFVQIMRLMDEQGLGPEDFSAEDAEDAENAEDRVGDDG